MKAKQMYKSLGLKTAEYKNILKILGRTPTPTELAMFSVEWSEHCGYPRSRALLKLLPKKGKYPTLFGTDAGGIKFGDLAIVFKMESHNHPSQIEPFQGAATGIGGIIRDIISMGAKPIALLNSLRFGMPNTHKNKYLLSGVVSGISFYGNCIGVPTVGGEVYFHPSYEGNCLVNVMCAGIAKEKDLAKSGAKPGNPVLFLGARTGKDGIGGCSILASAEFKDKEEKRPSVQVGDPFAGKCLIEATKEALETGYIMAYKDMGAAGLTCTTTELSEANNVGMVVELADVPLREPMEPYEIMMSESQERMLAVVKKGKEKKILDIFHKWNLEASVIGYTTPGDIVILKNKGEIVAEVPAKKITAAPLYIMPSKKPAYLDKINKKNGKIKKKIDHKDALLKLLSSPIIASKRWIFTQYDHMVQDNTIIRPGMGDAALVRIKGTNKAIALTSDCNSTYCYLDPYIGAQIAVCEAARNLVCVGADPAAVTDCLNFANPEKPDRFWQFKKCVEGIAESCKELKIAVVSGNVSFYNESHKGPIHPTPTIGMLGLIEDISKTCSMSFKNKDDIIMLLGKHCDSLGGSEYLKHLYRAEKGPLPKFNINEEKKVHSVCLKAIQNELFSSAHDCSEGGLLISIAESCITGNLGADINLDKISPELLFGESQSRIVVSLSKENFDKFKKLASKEKFNTYQILGEVTDKDLTLNHGKEKIFSVSLDKLNKAYYCL
ncbi:MAG: phosphoribosylformylglycinamidine synthase subunit PurL [Armatimonadota bacterium]